MDRLRMAFGLVSWLILLPPKFIALLLCSVNSSLYLTDKRPILQLRQVKYRRLRR